MTHSEADYRPTANLDSLRKRSQLLAKIREFFDLRDFIHVETPLLSRDTVVDRYLEPVVVNANAVIAGGNNEAEFFLQTSPEFAMKRLLAAGATAIYQICKAFRKGESGRRHNPEFTMLEWYRVGDDLNGGMDLLAEFAQYLFNTANIERIAYREAFKIHASIDPFQCSIADLRDVCHSNRIDIQSFQDDGDRDSWLNLVMSELVEPELGAACPEIVYHWPDSQSALAKVCVDANGHQVAERFELFYRGTELANGYNELQDSEELLRRNRKVNEQRRSDGVSELPVDSRMLEAMQSGLPMCSGVAMGVDRLMMLLLGVDSIEKTIPFPIRRA